VSFTLWLLPPELVIITFPKHVTRSTMRTGLSSNTLSLSLVR